MIVRGKDTIHIVLSFLLLATLESCDFKLKPFAEEVSDTLEVKIMRYDRLESLYLTTGDFSALQQMSTDYPIETRTLIENVLNLGTVSDPEINMKFLRFYQDSTLQTIISDAEVMYANVEDLNNQLTESLHRLKTMLPDIRIPMIYTQIGALAQSIVVGDASVGICLDKYLGTGYPLYKRYYEKEQRATMQRRNIVPDFLSCYLLSVYQMSEPSGQPLEILDKHLAKIQWVANKALGAKFFTSDYISSLDRYMAGHPQVTFEQLLKDEDYAKLMGR